VSVVPRHHRPSDHQKQMLSRPLRMGVLSTLSVTQA
jgi:hypothetical protein